MSSARVASQPRVPARTMARALLAGVCVVAGAGLAVELVHTRSHAPAVESLVAALSLSYEVNVPTWYATCLLFTAALALAAVAADVSHHRGPFRRRWWALAAIFAYLSLDEAIELHEHLGGMIGTGGLLYFDWVIPAAAVLLVLGAVYLPFLRHLPPVTRNRFVVAGAVYVGGALLMELPLGWVTERAGSDNLAYALIDWVEETLELAGASLFLFAVVDHARARPEERP